MRNLGVFDKGALNETIVEKEEGQDNEGHI